MKNILLVAFVAGNLGDDLFLKIVSSYKRKNNKYYILVNEKQMSNYSNLFKELDINPLCYSRIERKLDCTLFNIIHKQLFITYKLKKFDKVILVGGSLFSEHPTWKRNYILNNALNSFNNLQIIGSNFGPFHSTEFLETYSSLFKTVSYISMRDKTSLTYLPSNIQYAPDMVFSLYNSQEIIKKRKLGISIINILSLGFNEQDVKYYLWILMEHIDMFQEKGYEVELYGFQKDDLNNNITKYILQKYPNLKCIEYEGDIDNFLEKFSQCEYVLASRFHSMILGWIFKSKVFPISYQVKIKNTIHDLNPNGKYIDLEDYRLQHNYKNIEYYTSISSEKLEELSVLSLQHLKKI